MFQKKSIDNQMKRNLELNRVSRETLCISSKLCSIFVYKKLQYLCLCQDTLNTHERYVNRPTTRVNNVRQQNKIICSMDHLVLIHSSSSFVERTTCIYNDVVEYFLSS